MASKKKYVVELTADEMVTTQWALQFYASELDKVAGLARKYLIEDSATRNPVSDRIDVRGEKILILSTKFQIG